MGVVPNCVWLHQPMIVFVRVALALLWHLMALRVTQVLAMFTFINTLFYFIPLVFFGIFSNFYSNPQP
jgi:hypothetical protein